MARKFTLISFFLCFLSSFHSSAFAGVTDTIHAEWSSYSPPSGYSVAGYNLYQEGELACQAYGATSTSMDCEVSLNSNTTSFTLAVLFTDGSESPQSSPFYFTIQNVHIETGVVDITNQWNYITFEQTFNDPIVIVGPPTFNGPNPCVVRVRNISSSGFAVKLSEWDYLDGWHTTESVTYLVMERGSMVLPDGSMVQAGSFSGGISFKNIPFNKLFQTAPVVTTTIVSENGTDTIAGRINNITTSGFNYGFQEQELNPQYHVSETVNYIAWEPGEGTIDSLQYKVATTGNVINNYWHTVASGNFLNNPPFILTDTQTTNGMDPYSLRTQYTEQGFKVFLQEEQSQDEETEHVNENVGYIQLSQ